MGKDKNIDSSTELSYRILLEEACGEYEEKKSKFIAHIAHVETEEEANAYITSIKKKYYDARHNCSAMIIGSDSSLVRSSDDGEPSGTAGRPMTEVLKGEGLTNVVAVVTRYFGGVLLGTGGLVRAYTEAVKDALENAKIGTITYSSDIEIICDYSEVNSLQYFVENNPVECIATDYTDKVRFLLRCKFSLEGSIVDALTSLTQGKRPINVISRGYEALKD